MLDGHGDDSFRYDSPIRHNFSTNISPGADTSALMEHLANAGCSIVKCYPEPSPTSVETLLGKEHNVGNECVMVTNGATEAIYLTAHYLQSKHSAIVSPTFREYQDACALYGHKIDFITSIEDISPDVGAVWLCNPNNPTGHVTDKTTLLEHISSHPDITYIIDQAYSDYTTRPLINGYEAIRLPNVIILHSLTKRFSIPGLRIGYAISNPSLTSELRRHRMPWSVNSFAIEAAKFLLNRNDRASIDAPTLHNEALRIASLLKGIGIESSATDCNFMLCKLPFGSASDLKKFLIDNYGILIRDASNFEGLTQSYFRVAAQTREENNLLIEAITKWISPY